MVCISSCIWAGAALADVSFAAQGKAFAPQLRWLDHGPYPVEASALPSTRARGNFRQRVLRGRDFPASPPMAIHATDALMTLATAPAEFQAGTAQAAGPFRFEHNGGAVVREVPRGYRRMCDSLSGHIWNQPDGRRVCFDTRGKPGIAIQIPIN
jgi:hypothetical protein